MANVPQVAAAAVWLDVWERAAGAAPMARASLLLAPGSEPDTQPLTLGARDALLLDLRGSLFGPSLRSTATCPACQERCEWDCELDALRAATSAFGLDAPLEITEGDWEIRARAITAADLETVARCADEASAMQILLRRCVLEARHAGEIVDAAQLPEAWVDRVSATLAAADPQAVTSVALVCPACAHAWDASFDIGAYLWTELDAWAQRTLADVHELASRYGWSEPEILALSPARRARYIAMATA
jgi:hypothetical protein